jgi:hypothetical protein
MVLNNTLLLTGSYGQVTTVEREVNKLIKKDKSSQLYNKATYKHLKNIKTNGIQSTESIYFLHITFLYKKENIKTFIDLFNPLQVETIHMCENSKHEIWIVNSKSAIEKFRLIPEFAINEVLLEYMNYKESSIMLDSFETIKYDGNKNEIVVDNKKQTYDELLYLLFEKTIKGRIVFDVLEQFIYNYYEKCINSYESLYSSNNDKLESEEPTPLALFIVTFGIFALIGILLKFMGYY